MQSSERNMSAHILPTAANMLGICFVIFGLMKTYGYDNQSVIDEINACAMILFLAACLFSYASIRSYSERLERIADMLFLGGLVVITLITVIVALEIVR